ncbi:MAG TPA: DUF2058 domain-containing protein [Steroidobacteraceae bacterium]
MNTSLRDQLLKAGLINKKQANEAERQQQRQERQPPPKHKHAATSDRAPAPHDAQGAKAKAARDHALNRRQHEKAEKKARLAQINQLIEQNRLPTVEGGESYNFVDGSKIRRIEVNAAIRARLTGGEIVIVRHEGRYDMVPATIATRIRERDERAFVASGVGAETAHTDEAYRDFSVPDDLIW